MWGNISVNKGIYQPGTKDWNDTGEERPSMTIYEDAFSCACENQQFSSILKAIANAAIPYGPLSKNSNSTVGTMLRDSGYDVGPLPVRAPEFNTPLSY
jgi:hypothetical protein